MRTDVERLEAFLGDISPEKSAGPAALEETWHPPGGVEGPDLYDVQRRIAVTTLIALVGVALGILGLMLGRGGDAGWLLVSIALLAGMVVLYKNFEFGIVAFLGICWIAIGTPTVSGTGSGLSVRFLISQTGLMLLLMVWGTRIFVRREFHLYSNPLSLPIVLHTLFCAWSIANAFMFPDPKVVTESYRIYSQVNYYEMIVRFLSFGGLLMIANSLHGRALRWASLVAVVPGILTFTGLLPFIPSTTYASWPQIFSMAFLLSMVVTRQGKPWVRAAALGLAASIFLSYFARGTEWVSGWMGALMAIIVILSLTQRRLLLIGFAVLAVAVFVNWSYFYQTVYVDNFYAGSLENDRSRMLRAAFLYAGKFPLGVGLGNYRSYNAYYGRQEVWNTTTFFSAHGTYAQILSEIGWPGLLTLLWFLAAGTRMLYRYWRALPDGYVKTYMLGVLGGFVGVYSASFNGDYLFPAYHNGGMGAFGSTVYTFFMLGIAIAMARENGLVWKKLRQPAKALKASEKPPRPAPVINRPLRGASAASDASPAGRAQ